MSDYLAAPLILVAFAFLGLAIWLQAREIADQRRTNRALTEKLVNALLANEADEPAVAFEGLERVRETPPVPENVTEDFLTRERLSRNKAARDDRPQYDEPRPIGMGG